MSFGDLVQEERGRRGWSRAELARRAQTTAVSVWRVEVGSVTPGGSILASVLLALDPPPRALRRFLRAAINQSHRAS